MQRERRRDRRCCLTTTASPLSLTTIDASVSTAAGQSPPCEVEDNKRRHARGASSWGACLSLVAGKIVGKSRFQPVEQPRIDIQVIDIQPYPRANSL